MGNLASTSPITSSDYENASSAALATAIAKKPKTAGNSTLRAPLGEMSPNHGHTDRRYIDMSLAERVRTHNVSRPTDMKRRIHVEFDPATGTYKGLDEAIREVYSSPQRTVTTPHKKRSTRESLSPLKPTFKTRPMHSRIRHRLLPSSSTISESDVFPATLSPDSTSVTFQKHPDREEAGISAGLRQKYRAARQVVNSTTSGANISSSLRHSIGASGAATNVYVGNPTQFRHKTHVAVDSSSPTGFAGLPREWEIMLKHSGIDKAQAMKNPQELLDVLQMTHDKTYNPDKVEEYLSRHTPAAGVLADSTRLDKSVGGSSWAPKFIEADPLQIFERIVKIGEGSSGCVYRAWDPKKGVAVAIKRVTPKTDEELELFKFEIAVMSSAFHHNLIKCYSAYKVGIHLYVVMELADGGSLTDVLYFLNDRRMHLNEPEIAYICREVLQGLASLHGIKRIHRDIKSDNTLLTREGDVKIADFGFAAQLTDKSNKRNTVIGTPFWMAPECVRGLPYDCKVDVWATGVLAIECAEGSPPLLHETQMKAMFLIATQGPPTLKAHDEWTSDFHDFIAQCTVIDPLKRATAAEMLKHPFLKRAAKKDHMGRIFSVVADFREKESQKYLNNNNNPAATTPPAPAPVEEYNNDEKENMARPSNYDDETPMSPKLASPVSASPAISAVQVQQQRPSPAIQAVS